MLTQLPALGWAIHLCTDVPGIAGVLRLPSPRVFCSPLEQGSALKEVSVNAPFPCVALVFPAERL